MVFFLWLIHLLTPYGRLNPQKNQGNGGGQAYAAKAGLSKELWSRRGAKKTKNRAPGPGWDGLPNGKAQGTGDAAHFLGLFLDVCRSLKIYMIYMYYIYNIIFIVYFCSSCPFSWVVKPMGNRGWFFTCSAQANYRGGLGWAPAREMESENWIYHSACYSLVLA